MWILSDLFFWVPIGMGVLFMLIGWLTQKIVPDFANPFYGYRTPRSKKNKSNWDFAQSYSSRLTIRCGGALLSFSVILPFIGKWNEAAGIVGVLILTLAPAIWLIYSTENALKKHERSNHPPQS